MANRTYRKSNVFQFSALRRIETPKIDRPNSSSVSLQGSDVNEGKLPISYTTKWTSLSSSEVRNKSGITESFTSINGLQPNTAYSVAIITENVAESNGESASKRIATGNLAIILCRAGFTLR